MLSPETLTRLYDLAFQYKKTKIWETLYNDQMFAVQLSNGEIGYCCVMGNDGMHVALGVYVGQQGVSTLWDAVEYQDLDAILDPEDDAFMIVCLLMQNTVQCAFCDDDDVSTEELRRAREYARQLHTRMMGPFRVPQFVRYQAMYRPRPVYEEADADILVQCLQAALHVSTLLAPKGKRNRQPPLDLPPVSGPGAPIALFSLDGEGNWQLSWTEVPEYVSPAVPQPDPLDEVTVARLKRVRAGGTWQCAIHHDRTGSVEEDPYILPATPFIVDAESGVPLPLMEVGNLETDANRMYRRFVNQVIQYGTRPTGIQVHRLDLRGQAFFSVFARQLGIPIHVVEHLPELNDAMNLVNRPIDNAAAEEEMFQLLEEMCQTVLGTDLEDLRHAPREMQMLFRLCLEGFPEIPREVREKLEQSLPDWDLS